VELAADNEESPAHNVFVLDVRRGGRAPNAEPYLTDAERVEIRQMLTEWREWQRERAILMVACPTMRRALTDD
jgi:hypothetical protein